MKTSRMEAFSDGVIAVIITIMVLELKAPLDATPAALAATLPSLLVYALSFLTVAIMWVNHHHLIARANYADAALLWSNNNLLFWMSLIPFATAYLGQHHHAALAVAVYGALFCITSLSFWLVQHVIGSQDLKNEARRADFKRIQHKAIFSLCCYLAAVAFTDLSVVVSLTIFVIVPLLYFWPEKKGTF